MPRNIEADRINAAKRASGAAEARLWGMKYRAAQNPPRAAVGSFPYSHRTCAEWGEVEPKRARKGARMVLQAIERMAA